MHFDVQHKHALTKRQKSGCLTQATPVQNWKAGKSLHFFASSEMLPLFSEVSLTSNCSF